MKWGVTVFTLFWTVFAHAESGAPFVPPINPSKVAILLNSGDNGNLEPAMQSLEQEARRTYAKIGFRVIVIGGNNSDMHPTAPELERALSELQNITDLRLDFIGHGSLETSPDLKRFPPLPLATDRKENLEADLKDKTNLSFFAANISDVNLKPVENLFRDVSLDPSVELQSIGVGDIRKALAIFRRKNPHHVPVTILLLNCYSGAVAEQLRLEPDTLVLASAPAITTAVDKVSSLNGTMSSWNPKDWGIITNDNMVSSYYAALADSRNYPTFKDAWEFAQKNMRELFKGASAYHIGHLPETQYIMGWCNQNAGEFYAQQPVSTEIRQILTGVRDDINYPEQELAAYKNELAQQTGRFSEKINYEGCVGLAQQDRKQYFENLNNNQRLYIGFISSAIPKVKAALSVANIETQNQIRANLLESIARAMKWATDHDVAENRIQQIRTLEYEIQTAAWPVLLNAFLDSLQRTEKKCTSQPLVESCDVYKESFEVLVEALTESDKQEGCKDSKSGEDWNACLIANPINRGWLQRLDTVPPFHVPDFARNCGEEEYADYLGISKAIALDNACVERFAQKAGSEELVRLLKIHSMALRPTRG